MMKKITCAFWLILTLTSCGFQSRKYTRGYYGNDFIDGGKREGLASKYEYNTAPAQSNYISSCESQESPIDPTEKKFIKITEPTQLSTQMPELMATKPFRDNNILDTLKLGIIRNKEEQMAQQPPEEFQSLIKKSRRDNIALLISSLLMYGSTFIAFGSSSGLTSSIVVAIILILSSIICLGSSIMTIRNFNKLRKLMKSTLNEDKKKSWYSPLVYKKMMAILFFPFYPLIMAIAALALIIGMASIIQII